MSSRNNASVPSHLAKILCVHAHPVELLTGLCESNLDVYRSIFAAYDMGPWYRLVQCSKCLRRCSHSADVQLRIMVKSLTVQSGITMWICEWSHV